MGVRFASSRYLDVVVMAPALTEAGQSQNFKLSPTSHSAPVSPLGVLNGLNKYSVSKLLKNGLLGKTITKFSESEKLDSLCLNGNTNKLAEDSDSVSLDRLATLAIASELLKVGKGLQSRPTNLIRGALKGTSVQGGDSIMNNCDQFMEDDDINMGIQSTTPVSSLESAASSVKEKTLANDMDQIIKNLGAVISNDMGSSVDLGQNVDELLQVIKNMESNSTTDPDPSVFQHMEGSESEEMFPIPDGTDLAGGLSSFERVLFNDAVLDLCGSVAMTDNSVAHQNKELISKERIAESQKIQFELERKCDWLLRRLRKLQARAMGKHIGEELTGFLEQTHRLVEAKHETVPSPEDIGNNVSEHASTSNVPSGSPTFVIKSEQKVKTISSSAMSDMIQRLDLISQQQSSVRARRYSNNRPQLGIPTVMPKFDDTTRQELQHVSSQLHTQLKMIESAIDSDATASSSGGESCDEMQTFNNQHQIPLTISKRAAWKWSRDRAAIAGRWTWLQAQISDLEYRIRQHNEIHRQLRISKGPVLLGDHPVTSTTSTTSNRSPMVVNGFHGVLPGATPSKPRTDVLNGTVLGGASPPSPPTSRTRPLNRTMFRKRKLLQGAGLHLASRKAARPATTRCKCVLREKMENPCLLCTGRLDPTAGLQTGVMTMSERMAVLDPTLHPVLSFQDEVKESMHYAAEMQPIESQQKMLRTSLKVLKASTMKEEDHTLQERRNFKLDHQRKYKTRLKKNIHNSTLSSKIRRTLAKAGRKPKGYFDQKNHTIQRLSRSRQGQTRGAMGMAFNEHRYSADYTEESGGRGSRHPSPEPLSNSLSICERFAKERRKRENSYDIDNIIIPRSYSSAARVEIITYKEIPTPKWRVVDGECDLDGVPEKDLGERSNADSDFEDYSDEAIALRHEKCLAEEKKKFSLGIKLPPFLRGRAQRRTDSLAESSGANTPDPMSPANMLDQGGRESCSGSPMGSPPATPQPFATDTDSNPAQPMSIRRRTVSQSRWAREKEELCRSASPDVTPEVAPFEQRTFPLPDELLDGIMKSRPEEQVPPPIVIEEPKVLVPVIHRLSPTIEEDEEEDSELVVASRPASPCSESNSTDSALGDGDDPNDPEWTVQEGREAERERLKALIKR